VVSFLHNQSEWNKAYEKGEWFYLSEDVSELSRQGLVASMTSIYGKAGSYSILELGWALLLQFNYQLNQT
jgi:hypothetical protein